MMDTGILGEPLSIEPDVSHADLAEFGGNTLEALQQAGTRGRAVDQMRTFVRAKVADLHRQGLVLGASVSGAQRAL